MAITRAQQAKQMLQDGGMLVKPSTDGKRPGYRSAKTQEVQGRTTKSQGISPGQAAAMFGTDKAGIYAGMDKDAAEATIRSEVARQRNIEDLKDFKETTTPVNFPKFTPGGYIAETFFKKPIQKFADFTTARNRAFFEDVIRAGKIPGVTFADLQDPNFDLEEEYQEYMANRMAGKTDAYGNPVEGFSYDSEGKLVGNFRGDGRDPIPFIPPVVSQPEEQVTGYVNPLSLLFPRIAGTRFLGTQFEDEEDTEFAADGGRIGFAEGSYSRSYNPGAGGVVQHSPVSTNIGGGGDGPKTTPTNVGGGDGGVTTLKTKKDIKTPSDFTKFDLKDLVNLYQDEEDEDMKVAGLNQEQVDYLNQVGKKVSKVDATGDFFTYDSPANVKLQLEKLNPESESGIFSKEFDPDKIVAGDPNTYATEKDVQDYIKSAFPALTTGGREIGLAGGGIASLDREAFLLGGIAKGLKKAVRGVKKLAKSPIGKVALGAALFKFGGGLGGLKSKLFGMASVPGVPDFVSGGGTMGLFGKLGLTAGGGSLMPTLKGGITLATLLPLLAGKTEDEKNDILKDYYASQKLDPNTPLNRRILGTDFYGGQTAADGGRIGYQEGGDAEPVAKKTMPLIDMDGKEKDYRETGGFVDMGRMERADDVPARLSKNEFVFTADAVRNAGEGDIDKGAEVMYNMMKNLEAGGEVSEESQGLEGAREMFQTSQRLGEVI